MLLRVARELRTVFVLLFGLAGRAAAQQTDPELPSPEVQAAERDSANGRFVEAKAKLAAILASPSARPRDRDEAGTELARVAWRIDGDADAARARLEGLIPGARKKVRPLLLLARLERILGRFDAAAAAARRAREAAETKDERRSADVSLARALADRGIPVLLLFQPGFRHTALFPHDRHFALFPGHDRHVGLACEC